MTVDSYNIDKILAKDLLNHTRIHRAHHGWPFTILQEAVLVGSLLMAHEHEAVPITEPLVKQQAVRLANDCNADWDVEYLWDDWFDEFLARHPKVAICKFLYRYLLYPYTSYLQR